jgi:hypothetical protein
MLTRDARHARLWISAAVLFFLAWYRAGVEAAGWLIASWFVGYLIVFRLLEMGISTARRRKVSRSSYWLSFLALAGSVAIVGFGYGQVLALTTLIFLVIDLALRIFND